MAPPLFSAQKTILLLKFRQNADIILYRQGIVEGRGLDINTKIYKHKLWLIKRNRKRLVLRTQSKQHVKNRRTRENEYNRSLKIANDYNPQNNSFTFSAPLVFSFVQNASETSKFFNKLLRFIVDKRNFGRSIYIDISKITDLTIDALMYLLAILNNLNNRYLGKYSFAGNSPNDAAIRKRFNDSGFFRYVKRKRSFPLQRDKDNIQIVTGTLNDPLVAKSMSDYVCRVASIDKKDCQFLYVMMNELMSNTNKHAYDIHETILDPHWYCFAEYDNDNTIAFTFMDTGEGIPSTVQKNFGERVDLLKLKGDDKYVISALNGDFRTATKEPFRGKGLPKLRSFCSQGKIHNMRIVTNEANVTVDKDRFFSVDISPALRGTLYYWEIKLSDLKGVKNDNN